MQADTGGAAFGAGAGNLSPPWRQAAIHLIVVWLALFAVFASDWMAMANQWWNSSTYNHILFVPAIVVWLVTQRWSAVRQIDPGVCRWGLLAFGLSLLGWVLGSFAGLDLLRQAGAVGMLPSSALLALGPRASAALLFPLSYLGFLVPFGDELVPALQTLTAKLTIALVEWSGVPARIDGVFIHTPAGLFEVAEACSGVKFLVAMIALGALVANLGFRHWRRRVSFMALCVVVPILANCIRAWGTIFAAQYVGIETAVGIDHLIYGWVFFGAVIVAVLGVSARYFDRSRHEPAIDPRAILQDPQLARLEGGTKGKARPFVEAAALLMLGLAWSGAAQSLRVPVPAQVFLPHVAGWQRIDNGYAASWQPHAKGADHRLLGSYADASGARIDVFYALYSRQGDGREAGGFGQGALVPGGDWSWSRNMDAPDGAKGELLVYRGATERLAWTWYRSGGVLTGSNARLKLAQIVDRIMLRASPTAILILSAEQHADGRSKDTLATFHSAIGDPGAWMDRIAEQR